MTRALSSLLLLAAIAFAGFAGIPCLVEFSDEAEPCCEFCQVGQSPAVVAAAPLFTPPSEESQALAGPQRTFVPQGSLRDRQGRGPPC